VLATARRNVADEARRQAIIDAGTPVPDLVPKKKA
jgi:hypothetical protein